MSATTFEERMGDLQREIGALSMGFACLETALACAVGFLTNPAQVRTGQILTAELSFRARLAAFSSLYAERVGSATDQDSLQRFLSEAHQLEDQRNKLLHSFYWQGPVGDSRATRIKTTAKERKGLAIHFEAVTPTTIAVEAERAWKIPERLDELMLKIDGYFDYVGRFNAMFQEA